MSATFRRHFVPTLPVVIIGRHLESCRQCYWTSMVSHMLACIVMRCVTGLFLLTINTCLCSCLVCSKNETYFALSLQLADCTCINFLTCMSSLGIVLLHLTSLWSTALFYNTRYPHYHNQHLSLSLPLA